MQRPRPRRLPRLPTKLRQLSSREPRKVWTWRSADELPVRVGLVARSVAPLREAAIEQRNSYPSALVNEEALDVGNRDAFEKIEAVLAKHGLYLDVLVNNAGIAISGPFSVQDPSAIDQLVETNIAALRRLTRMALPLMRARGRGGIINLSSLGSFTPGPWNAAYFALQAKLTFCRLAQPSARNVAVRACACAR